jgi:hypothetical protein
MMELVTGRQQQQRQHKTRRWQGSWHPPPLPQRVGPSQTLETEPADTEDAAGLSPQPTANREQMTPCLASEVDVIVTPAGGAPVEAKAFMVSLGNNVDGYNTPGFRISRPEILENKTFKEGDPACVLKFSPKTGDGGGGSADVVVAATSTSGAPASEATASPVQPPPSHSGGGGGGGSAASAALVPLPSLQQRFSDALGPLANFHLGRANVNKTNARDTGTWLLGMSSHSGTQDYVVETIPGGAALKAIPFSAHPTLTAPKTVVQAIPNDSSDPRTFVIVNNFCLTGFGDDTAAIKVKMYLAQALTETKCFERKGDNLDPRGICGDPRSDGVRMGDQRYLNDGTKVLVLGVGLVDDSRASPFTFLVIVFDLDALKTCLVPHSSIMKIVNEEKMPTQSSSLPDLSASEEALAIAAGVEYLRNETPKDNTSVFYCQNTETLWLGGNNRIPHSPHSKKGRKTLVDKGDPPVTLRGSTGEKPQTKKAKKAAAAAAAAEQAATAPSTSTSLVSFESRRGGSKRGGSSGTHSSGVVAKRPAFESLSVGNPEAEAARKEANSAVLEAAKTAASRDAAVAIAKAEASRDAAEAALKASQDSARVQATHTNQLRAIEAQGNTELLKQFHTSAEEVKALLKDQIQMQAGAAQQQMQHGTETNAQFLDYMRATSSSAGTSGSGESDLQLLLRKVGVEETHAALQKAGVTSVAVLRELVEDDAESVGLKRFQLRALLRNID